MNRSRRRLRPTPLADSGHLTVSRPVSGAGADPDGDANRRQQRRRFTGLPPNGARSACARCLAPTLWRRFCSPACARRTSASTGLAPARRGRPGLCAGALCCGAGVTCPAARCVRRAMPRPVRRACAQLPCGHTVPALTRGRRRRQPLPVAMLATPQLSSYRAFDPRPHLRPDPSASTGTPVAPYVKSDSTAADPPAMSGSCSRPGNQWIESQMLPHLPKTRVGRLRADQLLTRHARPSAPMRESEDRLAKFSATSSSASTRTVSSPTPPPLLARSAHLDEIIGRKNLIIARTTVPNAGDHGRRAETAYDRRLHRTAAHPGRVHRAHDRARRRRTAA